MKITNYSSSLFKAILLFAFLAFCWSCKKETIGNSNTSLRVHNVSPNIGSIDVRLANSTISGLGYKESSDFYQVESGLQSVEISQNGETLLNLQCTLSSDYFGFSLYLYNVAGQLDAFLLVDDLNEIDSDSVSVRFLHLAPKIGALYLIEPSVSDTLIQELKLPSSSGTLVAPNRQTFLKGEGSFTFDYYSTVDSSLIFTSEPKDLEAAKLYTYILSATEGESGQFNVPDLVVKEDGKIE